jgi:MFS family permease
MMIQVHTARAVFFLNGLTLSTFIVRQPTVKVAHHLTDGQLGVLGMLFAVAALAAMQCVGPLVARFGVWVLRASLAVMPVLLCLIGMAANPIQLALVTTALGGAHGATDAAMNAYAVSVERAGGRAILNGCHAAWSVSAVLASLVTAGLARAGVGLAAHLAGAGAVLLAAGVLVGALLVPVAAGPEPDPVPGRRAWRAGWTRAMVVLGLTGTALMVCEGAALGWGGVFLHDSRHASLGLAAVAVTAYTAGQTGGRLFGDRLVTRYPAGHLFRAGGLVAAGGLAAAVIAPRPLAAVAGFAVMGVGTSVLIPLTFSAVGQAGRGAADTAALVSRFTTFTYAGILLGPAAIGWAAQLAGLTWTLAALVPVLSAVALLTRLPARTSPATTPCRPPAGAPAARAAGTGRRGR